MSRPMPREECRLMASRCKPYCLHFLLWVTCAWRRGEKKWSGAGICAGSRKAHCNHGEQIQQAALLCQLQVRVLSVPSCSVRRE